jgi:multidrug efflux pump subunit AcrA (membrane-fusion protein)
MKSKILISFLLITVVASLVYFLLFKNKKGLQADKLTPHVNVVQVKSSTVQITYEFPAKTVPVRVAEVRPQVDGIVIKQFFKDGDFVQKGQKLYAIDPASNIIIPAPITGHISRTYITEGTLVSRNQQQALARITQINPIYVDIAIPSTDFTTLKQYQDKLSATLVVNGIRYPHSGVIKSKEVFLDETTDSITIRAEFPNAEGQLLAGEFVVAEISTEIENSISVPQQTVILMPNGSMSVLKVENGTIVQTTVSTYKSDRLHWGVSSGLNDGDLIIYEGQHKYKDGQSVQTNLVNIE